MCVIAINHVLITEYVYVVKDLVTYTKLPDVVQKLLNGSYVFSVQQKRIQA